MRFGSDGPPRNGRAKLKIEITLRADEVDELVAGTRAMKAEANEAVRTALERFVNGWRRKSSRAALRRRRLGRPAASPPSPKGVGSLMVRRPRPSSIQGDVPAKVHEEFSAALRDAGGGGSAAVVIRRHVGRWVDPETGLRTEDRKSGKKRRPSAAFIERGRELIEEARRSAAPKRFKRVEVDLQKMHDGVQEMLHGLDLTPGAFLAALQEEITRTLKEQVVRDEEARARSIGTPPDEAVIPASASSDLPSGGSGSGSARRTHKTHKRLRLVERVRVRTS